MDAGRRVATVGRHDRQHAGGLGWLGVVRRRRVPVAHGWWGALG